MSIKIKTRPHSGGSKFGRKIIFMGKRSLKDKAMAVIHYMSGKERITKKSFLIKSFNQRTKDFIVCSYRNTLDVSHHLEQDVKEKNLKQ